MMQSIEARADLQAQREVVQAASALTKSQSVLQYSCFDQFLNHAALTTGKSFSENKSMGATASDTSLDENLKAVVSDPMKEYMSGAYDHDFVGGQFSATPAMDNSVKGASYACDKMNQVWEHVSCAPFGGADGKNGFFTFEEFAAMEDVRNNPTLSKDCTPPKWAEIEDISVGNTPWRTGAWKDEQSQSYFDLMDPTNCGGIKPILTGVIVRDREEGSEIVFDEAVCSAPGCYFDGNNKCVSNL